VTLDDVLSFVAKSVVICITLSIFGVIVIFGWVGFVLFLFGTFIYNLLVRPILAIILGILDGDSEDHDRK